MPGLKAHMRRRLQLRAARRREQTDEQPYYTHIAANEQSSSGRLHLAAGENDESYEKSAFRK